MTRSLVLMALLLSAPAAFADDVICQEVRDASFDACYRSVDSRRAECFAHCDRCRGEVAACRDHCEHFCDSPESEGCAFDLYGCTTRCEHRCHERVCEDNPGCKAWWCNGDNVKSCVSTCKQEYAALATCRASWCGDGKARKQCLDGCQATEKTAAACRKAWCGDGATAQRCYAEADQAEQDCRKQVDAEYKKCLDTSKVQPKK